MLFSYTRGQDVLVCHSHYLYLQEKHKTHSLCMMKLMKVFITKHFKMLGDLIDRCVCFGDIIYH